MIKSYAENLITEWCDPKSRLKSQYGNVSYQQWCELEVERMRANGGSAVLVTRKYKGKDEVAVARSKSQESNDKN